VFGATPGAASDFALCHQYVLKFESVAKTEIILNLAWMLVCIGGLGAQVWMDRMRSGSRSRKVCLRRTLSVLIAALALFPVISASDDRIRLSDLSAAPGQGASVESGAMRGLLSSAPLEDPEHGQTAEPIFLPIIVCLFLIARPHIRASVRWFSISAVGRAPPALA
jgi:hypothetical protein